MKFNQYLQGIYNYAAENKIWIRENFSGISYSDGEATENNIYDIIANSQDISVLSPELRNHCTNWANTYHLATLRANILRPFEFIENSDVLEVGAGCGAITRYLGESKANVLALEGSPRRASIARSRTRDLDNVEVVCENFDEFKLDYKFDVITLIGVLEYSNVFMSGENSSLAMLKRVKEFLKPDGRLIIAIENQFGLKYFAGAPEDHLGQPMYGIEARYGEGQPQTFGKKVLLNMLVDAGYKSSDFLYPFPDYKLPVSILTEEGIRNEYFDASAFAWQSVRRDPQLPPYCNFSMELTWPDIFINGLGGDLANSFLIVSSPENTNTTDKNYLAYHYSSDRMPNYCKETVFKADEKDRIRVEYKKLSKDTVQVYNKNNIVFHCPDFVEYSRGTPLSWDFIKIVTLEGWCISDAGNFINRYVSSLDKIMKESKESISMDTLSVKDKIPGKYFDAIPQNIIIRSDGSPKLIDPEWSLSHDFEFGYLLFRAFYLMTGMITSFGKEKSGQIFTRKDFVLSILQNSGYIIEEDEIDHYLELEVNIQEEVTGNHANLEQVISLSYQNLIVYDMIHKLRNDIDMIYKSTSWKLTKPVRWLAGKIR